MKITLVSFLLVLGMSLAPFAQTSEKNASPTAEEILSLINQERKSRNMLPLTLDPKLMKYATEWAMHMARENKMSHRSGGDMLSFIEKNHMNGLTENVAYTTQSWTAQDIVSLWMKSDGHRANLLKKDSTICGIATAANPSNCYAVFNGARHDAVTKGN